MAEIHDVVVIGTGVTGLTCAREALENGVSVLTIESLLYGGLRPSDAVRLGLADADARTLARADAILAMPPPSPVDPF